MWLDEVRDQARIDSSSFTGEQTRHGSVPPPAVSCCTGTAVMHARWCRCPFAMISVAVADIMPWCVPNECTHVSKRPGWRVDASTLNRQLISSPFALGFVLLPHFSVAADNALNQQWLDYHNFEAAAPPLGFDFGRKLGVGLSHTVKVQMTPMGTVDNSITINNCTFQGRCHLTSFGPLHGALASAFSCRTLKPLQWPPPQPLSPRLPADAGLRSL